MASLVFSLRAVSLRVISRGPFGGRVTGAVPLSDDGEFNNTNASSFFCSISSRVYRFRVAISRCSLFQTIDGARESRCVIKSSRIPEEKEVGYLNIIARLVSFSPSLYTHASSRVSFDGPFFLFHDA